MMMILLTIVRNARHLYNTVITILKNACNILRFINRCSILSKLVVGVIMLNVTVRLI